MIKIEPRGGGTVYLAPAAIASLEETHLGSQGITTVVRTFDGRRYEVGSYASGILDQLAALSRAGQKEPG